MFFLLRLLFRVVTRYKNCARCGRQYIARPISDEIEIGRESIQCQCGMPNKTEFREWVHFSLEEKQRYFLWNIEIQIFAIIAGLSLIGGYFVGSSQGAWHAVALVFDWVFIVGFFLLFLSWTIRGIAVRKSLRIQPYEDPMFQPGTMPWEW